MEPSPKDFIVLLSMLLLISLSSCTAMIMSHASSYDITHNMIDYEKVKSDAYLSSSKKVIDDDELPVHVDDREDAAGGVVHAHGVGRNDILGKDESVACDSYNSCPSRTTCCCIYTYGPYCYTWGCCPFESAVCCDDPSSCCPGDRPICNTRKGTCSASKNSPLSVEALKRTPALRQAKLGLT